MFSLIRFKIQVNNRLSEISGSQGGKYEDDSLLGYSAVQSR
jgi:hypothetical protein